MAQVVLENIYKTYQKGTTEQDTAVLRSINLLIEDGEFMVLVGPSGCGKSTLLRLIAGLEDITAGSIRVSDRTVNDLPPKERDIAMVFQNYALYPHMSVYDNLAFGLRRTKLDGQNSRWIDNVLVGSTRKLPTKLRYVTDRERAVQERVKLVAQMLQIEPLLKRLPKQLSGGQKQRVALGRAMARNPQVFLMDEPLSNLDAKLRAETRAQIVKLQRQLGTTTIYVTHDQTEAMTMGDRIAVMNAGQIQQLATPLELYHRPANRFVAEFIGSPPMNFLPMQVRAPFTLHHALFRLTLPDSWKTILTPYDGRMVTLGIRPEHLSVGVPSEQTIPVKVDLVEALGSETYLAVKLRDNSDLMQVRIDPDRRVRMGEELWLAIAGRNGESAINNIHIFDCDTGVALRADALADRI